jgi:hypothetical protein
MSPGTGANIEFGVSTGGLDFMSSSGYPQIEFGYDDATDNEEDSGDDEDEASTNPDEQIPKGGGNQRHNLVSRLLNISLLMSVFTQTIPGPLSTTKVLDYRSANHYDVMLTFTGSQTN